jgi:hypothetical protein
MEFKAAVITIKFLLKFSPISNSDYSQDSHPAYQNLFPWSRKTSNAQIPVKKSVFGLFQEYSICLKSFIQSKIYNAAQQMNSTFHQKYDIFYMKLLFLNYKNFTRPFILVL